jgi:hypothetical protein
MSNKIFHFSNSGISSGQRFYLKDDVSGIFVRNLNIDSNFPILGSNLVYNTGNQTISGIKTFIEISCLKNATLSGDVINKKYADENLVKYIDNTLSYNTNLDLSFPIGLNGIKKINYTLRQPSGFGWGVNYNNITWLTNPPPNPTTASPVVFEYYPSGPNSTQSYGIYINAIADLEKNRSTIVYTTGTQIISGQKSFTDNIFISGSENQTIFFGKSNPVDLGTKITIQTGDMGIVAISRGGSYPSAHGYGIVFAGGGRPISGVWDKKGYLTAGNVNPTGYNYATLDWTNRILSGEWKTDKNIKVGDAYSVLTTGDQNISGVKTFTTNIITSGGLDLNDIDNITLSGVNVTIINGDVFLTNTIMAPNLIYNTGNQTISGIKTFASRPTVNGTGVLLSGEAAALPTTIVYTTGTQTISGNKNFISRPTVNGIGIFLSTDIIPVTATGLNIVYVTGDQTITGIKTFKSELIAPNIVYNTGYQSINIGFNNAISGSKTNFIINDTLNIIPSGAENCSIINGISNEVAYHSGYGQRNNIYGGYTNFIKSGSDNTLIGGSLNEIYGNFSSNIGGVSNFSSGNNQKLFTHYGYAVGNHLTLLGGTSNVILGGELNTIIGGNKNVISETNATGRINTIINSWASNISGLGKSNLIINGAYHDSSGDYNNIINGYLNAVIGRYNNIFNGYGNYIHSGSYSTILNGLNNNLTNANNSSVLHGSQNIINSNNSIAIGNKNFIEHSGATLISDSTTRSKFSRAENTLSLNFANGVYLENDVVITNLKLLNKKYTDYSYKAYNFTFSSYMNITNSTSTINAILPPVEDGRNFFVKNINTGKLIITSADTIDGYDSITLYKNESIEFLGVDNFNYNGWLVIGGNQGIN